MTARMKPLSTNQERNLVEFLDESFLAITRQFKKRSQPTTELPTLSLYLDAMRKVLSLILQIPPIEPSASLRTTFLLRLTGDALNSIPGYPPDSNVIPDLLDWLDDLDQAWICVLRSCAWDPAAGTSVDPVTDEGFTRRSSPASQTDRIRLHSLLVTGAATLEEWLNSSKADDENIQTAFGRLRVQDGFQNLFAGTLEEIGALSGVEMAGSAQQD